ncbi:hypothetical protein AB7M56_005736 [Bradyrhizobium elkanii]|nr:hypothetical protein [Bradyrhizobium elkanii]MCS3518904.1 hypothetical protein [Bradyrhizobium elkanii]MCS4075462.1 hypothetical protein [Bradyrhizobium elkanii]MCS4082095.1 hypothetical protein [Bradyrhizobium elkanii]MCS4106739.1 hypothetical protein [Bradyrhizobium elkanii]
MSATSDIPATPIKLNSTPSKSGLNIIFKYCTSDQAGGFSVCQSAECPIPGSTPVYVKIFETISLALFLLLMQQATEV